MDTFHELLSERGDGGKIWASALKQAIKRRKPDFNESYYGFRAFGNLLEAAQTHGMLELGRDERSGTYVYRTEIEDKPQTRGKGRTDRKTVAKPAAVLAPAASPSEPGPAKKAGKRAVRAPRKTPEI